MSAPRRRNLRFAFVLVITGLLTAVVVGGVLDGFLRRARREQRTAEAIASAKTPSSFQSAVMALGCSSAVVLPLTDFADTQYRAMDGSSRDLTLVYCEGGDASLCRRAEDVLARSDRPPGGLLVVAGRPGTWQCQSQFDAHNSAVGQITNGVHTVCFTQPRGPLIEAAALARALSATLARAYDR